MSILRRASTAAAISVAGVGIAVGGVGLASAGDSTPGEDAATQAAGPTTPGEGRGHVHGRGDRDGRGGPGEIGAGLAEALGLEESDVTAALRTVHEQREPGAAGEAGARADREVRQAELAAALADELDVAEQDIADALESMATDRAAAARSSLGDRLDTAVDDGSLTQADKQSVLKAFDAGVLGGGRRGPSS